MWTAATWREKASAMISRKRACCPLRPEDKIICTQLLGKPLIEHLPAEMFLPNGHQEMAGFRTSYNGVFLPIGFHPKNRSQLFVVFNKEAGSVSWRVPRYLSQPRWSGNQWRERTFLTVFHAVSFPFSLQLVETPV